MIDVERIIRNELTGLLREPTGHADWADVLLRSGARPRRAWALVAAAVLAVVLAAAALATTLGGFDEWLRGSPGKPASSDAQERFRAANGRSWVAFPPRTQLRELIRTEAGGRELVLFGFRSGDSLCLKLAIERFARQPQSCAPRSVVARTSAPIVVALGDYTLSDRAARPWLQLAFGIAADGVSRVDVHATDGVHRAVVGGNAYLFVLHEPNSANRVLRFVAHDTRGRTVVTPALPHPWVAGRTGRPGGPTRVEATIKRPDIGWLRRGERRGIRGPGGIRVIKPDPLSNIGVGLSGFLCIIDVEERGIGAQGCGPKPFARGPVNAMISCSLCGEFMEVRGAAADGVARLTLYLSDGTRQAVPLRDNVFAARVGRAQIPFRIVGYDAKDRVVVTQVWGASFTQPTPAAARRLRRVHRVAGPNGAVAILYAGPTARGHSCTRVEFSNGAVRGGCSPFSRPRLGLEAIQPVGGDLFVIGPVSSAAKRVEIRFSDGDKVSGRPVANHFVLAVPRDHLSERRQRAFLAAFDDDGRRTGRQRIYFRLP